MAEEHIPVALADAHASVAQRHVPAAIVHGAARARAEEIDQEFSAMCPEAKLWIGLEPGKQVIRHRRDRATATNALVEGLLLVAHRVLLRERLIPFGQIRSSRQPPGNPSAALGQRELRPGRSVGPLRRTLPVQAQEQMTSHAGLTRSPGRRAGGGTAGSAARGPWRS